MTPSATAGKGGGDALIREAERLRSAGRLTDALARYRALASGRPRSCAAEIGIANLLIDLWSIDAAIGTYEKALELAPGSAELNSAVIFFHQYAVPHDRRRIFELSSAFAQALERSIPRMPPPAPRAQPPRRRIRVGYVSPNFSRHSVGYFIEPVIARHDRSRFEVYAYYAHPRADDTTERMRGLVDGWRHIAALDDDTVARMVRADEIDILVDLAGHSKANRLPVFARRPAPVQMTWLGYPGTTGLSTIDYRITDRVADPEPLADRWHTEHLLRIDDLFLTYQPPHDCPAVDPRPPGSGIVFASFNNLAKLNDPTIALWARILAAVPGARLVIKSAALDYPETVERLTDRLEAQGMDPDRVELVGFVRERTSHLAHYGEVDIALDAYPYNGTTTTCEALWMGVPVVTLAGEAHLSRVGATLLAAVGLAELVATDEDHYVKTAVALAADDGRRRELRAALRDRMRASPLLDHAGFTRKLERRFIECLAAVQAEGAHTP